MRLAGVLEGDSVFISLNQSSSGTSGFAIHSGSVQSGTSTRRLFGTSQDRLSFNRLMDSSPNSGSLMVLDEIRLTSPGNTKSSDRAELEYDNQSNPSTFWTAGTVFVPGGSPLQITPITINSSSIALNPIVTFEQSQKIGNITASFADDLYSVKYKLPAITVSFKG